MLDTFDLPDPLAMVDTPGWEMQARPTTLSTGRDRTKSNFEAVSVWQRADDERNTQRPVSLADGRCWERPRGACSALQLRVAAGRYGAFGRRWPLCRPPCQAVQGQTARARLPPALTPAGRRRLP